MMRAASLPRLSPLLLLAAALIALAVFFAPGAQPAQAQSGTISWNYASFPLWEGESITVTVTVTPTPTQDVGPIPFLVTFGNDARHAEETDIDAADLAALRAGLTISANTDSASLVVNFPEDDDMDNDDFLLELDASNLPQGYTETRHRRLGLTIKDNDGPVRAPDFLTAYMNQPGELMLKWKRPTHTEVYIYTEVTGYEVQYTSAAASSVADDAAASGTDPAAGWVSAGGPHPGWNPSPSFRMHFIRGLTNGTQYRVRVRYSNLDGAGTWGHTTGTPLAAFPTVAPNVRVPRPYVLPIEVVWQDHLGLPPRRYEVHYTSAASSSVADGAAASGTDPATGWVEVKRAFTRSIHSVNGHNTYSFMRVNEDGHARFDVLERDTEYRIRVRALYRRHATHNDIPGNWGHKSVLVGDGAAVGVYHKGGGQELTGSAFVSVRLTNPVSHAVTVDYATADFPVGATVPGRPWQTISRAIAGEDYTAISGTLTFAPGETEKGVRIPVINDDVEDSGEQFQFVISNPQPDNIRLGWAIEGLRHTYKTDFIGNLYHTVVTTAAVSIYNSEADLGSLKVEGAPGDQGPWSALDLGAFVAERTAYAVTVPHGTTHARLTAATVYERQRIYTRVPRDGGTSYQQMINGEAGPAFALNVGQNTLFVESYRGGEEKKYTVKVTREAPQGDVAIVNESGTRQVSLSGMFDDDALTITASSSDESVATVAVSADYSTLTVSARAPGAATITVTAADGKGGTVEDTLTVTVKAAPVVASAIADVSGLEAGSTRNISLAGVFSDADGDALTITAASSDETKATVAVASDGSSLAVSGKGEGSASITVTAQDTDGNRVSDSFTVTVSTPANRPPTVSGAISDASIVSESGTRQVSLFGLFSDADGDDLTVTASSSDESVATVEVSADYSTLTVTAKAGGTATITVTASDGNGGTVDDSFAVTVKGAPTVASPIADVSRLEVGSTRNISLAGVFSDALAITAASSDERVATVAVSVDHSTLTVSAHARGTAIITVTASDGDGRTVDDSFAVTVKGAPTQADLRWLLVQGASNGAGPWTKLDFAFDPDTTEYAVTAPLGTTVARVMGTPEYDANGEYRATLRSGAGSELKAARPGFWSRGYALAAGGNAFVVEATAEDGTTKTYTVTVTLPTNDAPTVASGIADATIVNESGTRRVSLSGVFSDPDGDALAITASSSDDSVATVSVSADQSTLTVQASSRGTATIRVNARDGKGGTADDTFTVTVKAAPVVASPIADISGLEAGDSRTISMSGVFSDADGDALTITAASSDDGKVTVAVAADQSKLTVAGVAEGTATITVTAQDADGNTVSEVFEVSVAGPANNAPMVSTAIADATIVNESGTHGIPLSGVFADGDADDLTITASSSDENVATVSVASDYSTLTVTAKDRGTATITVTASDGKGGSVEAGFNITVKAAPVVASPIADVSELDIDATHEVSMSGVFSDPDGDAVTVTEASSSDTSIAAVSAAIDGATAAITGLTVTANSEGTATITLTARDADGNTVSDTFDVTVNAPAAQQQKVNNPSTVASAIADATIVSESETRLVSLSGVFDDADGDNLTITVGSSDESTATVSVSADHSTLTVAAKSRGTATITVTADDGYGGSVADSFTVRVKAAPVVASAISDVSGLEVGATREVSLSGVFSDADGDSLNITATSSDEGKATVSVAADRSALTVSGVAEGTATITVTAQDADGNTVSDAFQVEVVQVPEPEPEPVELPGPVLGLELTATHDSVSVSWSAPESGDAPDGYIVHLRPEGGSEGSGRTKTPRAGKTAVAFDNVESGQTYEVWVRAENEAGKGERVKASVTLPSVLPGRVTGLEVVATGDGVAVSWSAPETGGAADGYIVHLRPEGGAEGSGRTKTPRAKKTKVSFDNLEAGRTYQVWVRAENEAGKGERVRASITLPEAEPAQQDPGEQGDGQQQDSQSGQ